MKYKIQLNFFIRKQAKSSYPEHKKKCLAMRVISDINPDGIDREGCIDMDYNGNGFSLVYLREYSDQQKAEEWARQNMNQAIADLGPSLKFKSIAIEPSPVQEIHLLLSEEKSSLENRFFAKLFPA